MLKRILFFDNPAYLKLDKNQLVVETSTTNKSIPVEDLASIVLSHPQITISHQLLRKLMEHNVVMVTSDEQHLPQGLLLPLEGNTIQQERYTHQVSASLPLRKFLWQQTIVKKIQNQARHLESRGVSVEKLELMAQKVASGDSSNREAVAAAYYWPRLFDSIENFTRDRYGEPPNNALNYGYAILRAAMARALVGAGLLPTLGIHHSNRYNAFCLADDIMEPYRPYIDQLVCEMYHEGEIDDFLTKENKAKFISAQWLDVTLDGKQKPMMVALQKTAFSLYQCYSGESRKIQYPNL